MDLYHYTCDHSHSLIGEQGFLRSAAELSGRDDLPGIARWIWLTDLAVPDRNALGLTSHSLSCDRMVHRYRVVWDYQAEAALPWMKVRMIADPAEREDLESAHGARPRHWFVTRWPIEVRYDPLNLARAG